VLFTLLASLFSCADGGGWGQSVLEFSGPTPRNLLVISVDTLRRDRVGRYSGLDTTPFLDGLLAGGVVLDDHRSCSSWTYPSVVCALTGRDLMDLGWVPQRTPDGGLEDLPGAAPTLASMLQPAGWRTALVSGNAFLGPGTDADRGYQSSVVVELAPADEIAALGLSALDGLQASLSPWLLHLHFMDPHLPYAPPERYLEALPALDYPLERQADFDALEADWPTMDAAAREAALAHAYGRYDAELRYLDDTLADLWATLGARGALDDTLVVFWSDHGEQILDHGEVAHGNGLYTEENAAAAAFFGPGLTPRAWAGPTAHEDLLPTLLAGIAPGLRPPVDGVVVGGDANRQARFAATLGENESRTRQSVDRDGLRLIYGWEGRLELFDLAEDPTEQRDLYAPGHPDLAPLWDLLEPQVQRAASAVSSPQPSPPTL